ncbi:hypothetical protein BMF77_01426 [Dolichospermum sp. UHCC 0315A]|uniref:hypothetical protein n=1 Tax=Dolichospermum lemmermannii TaxID=54295 RepID=UPI00125A10A9|nr:hypothetical protein [Dolichospermum lemmermannii]MDB9438216.1 hypothetical protein [Dolichospermum lemmermannii CS-548]QEI40848.1 hypothetical protein BMF77_01426 [Dolichospermum sp. UHCC 0315A]
MFINALDKQERFLFAKLTISGSQAAEILREFHKKDDPILWDGHLARPCVVSGQDARTTRDFGIFF